MIFKQTHVLLACLIAFFTCLAGGTKAYSDAYDIYSRLNDNAAYPYMASPQDWRDINMYQLFTDRFFDGNSGNNLSRSSTTGTPWYNQSGSSAENDRHLFQGGDWAGIRQKLDYLKGMGVNCIWISGVQMNEQGFDKRFTPYHAYHPANFYRCEPMFGTFAELKSLIDTAHSNGIYVVIDVVVNHMADLMKYTDCNCNYSGYCENNCAGLGWWDSNVRFGAPFDNPQWFHNNGNIGDNDWDTYPRYIKGAFLGTEDLKTEDPTVQNELKIAFKNLLDATDCDGFRVDAIKHMEYDFIKQWADDMRKHAAYRGKSNFILFGEYFSYDDATQASYCKDAGFSFNSTLWFPMQQTLKNVFAYEQGTVQLVNRMNAMSSYGEAADKLVAFMDNHDVDRIALECGSQWESKLRPALTFLYTAMPVPCLFYGTEHGFNQGERRNGPPAQGQADFQRENMFNFGFQWGNANGDKFTTSALYNHIKKLNELRNQYISLRRGSITQRWSENSKGLFAISRVHGNEEALIAINTDGGSKSCNPQVGKPDGTSFVNALNPSETIVVSGGRLAISVDGKGSKIFISGLGNSSVETSCNTTTLTIAYKPNGGVLAAPIGAVHIGIGHDGGQGIADYAMTPSGNNWTYGYALTNATNSVSFWFHDEAQPPTYDNNGSQNWTIDITGCGEPNVDLAWIGNASHWPANGEWDPGEPLWINIESYPQVAAIDGSVVYSSNGGTTWTTAPLSANGTVGNNDAWHVNLGSFPGGTTVRYAVSLRGRNATLWDNNSSQDYTTRVSAAATTVSWIGNTYHWPENGTFEPGSELWINVESHPVGAGVTGEVVYSSNGGATWSSQPLNRNGTISSNDWWNVNLGAFPADTTIRYAVKVRDGDAVDHWDNHGGSNFIAIVNSSPSSIRWFGNTVQGSVLPPEMGIGAGTSGAARIDLFDLASNAIYTIMRSQDLVTWTNVAAVNAEGLNEFFALSTNETASTGGLSFYRLRVDWVPGSAVYHDKEALISIETWPIGGATNAMLVYTLDNGAHWSSVAMQKTGARGDNDVWAISLGMLPIGTVIKYAVEVRDNQGQSLWDNNNSQDFQFQVFDPNQTDHTPPTAGYSPQNTITTNTTLSVTLSALDDQDPSPVIYFTTNGSAPSTASTVYSAPILVTDQGSGVDRTIKFFARDASGNTSGVTTVEVKVNNTFSFGGNDPYSSNPTLGHSVANGSITADGVNNGEWDDAKLIALDMANDDPRTLGDNWTTHEAPIDLTHLWAAWDDTTLYLAWQYVDVTDIIDGANAGSALAGRISGNDGILQWIAIDTQTGGASKDMWNKNHGSNYWTGIDRPDVQIYMAGSLWQGYLSRALNGVFPVDDGGVNYFSAAQAGVTYGKGARFVGSSLKGVSDADNRLGAPNRNFITDGHSTSRDSFYEIAIPLSTLQITRNDIESKGIGVLVAAGSMSAMDSLPHDETTVDKPGTESWNSSFEWADTDAFTTPFARIGAGK
ncbi:MAG TPA: hypothetical protein DCZ95_15520 [Verrucomicrobia bacterium]|nr:MAG: hypothetical protein A2X46_02715 [Lentisphaerae bacterium GWF2_57_35]HBA85495.1 hypothetical protein [Verrucomicrobiota bacterium]